MIHQPPIVENETPQSGGVDELVSALMDHGLRSLPNPLVRAIAEEVHERVKPSIQSDLRNAVGPGTKGGKVISELVNGAGKVYQRMKRERA